jgi:peroxiredoxin Q/BCP
MAYVEVGEKAPAFTLNDQSGQSHKLSSLKGKWVVLYFYPKDDTSGCTKQACQFNDAIAQFRKRGVMVFGVSPDDEKSHAKFAGKYGLGFPLLADPDKQALEAYGVWQEKSMYGRKYMGVARTTYLIDPKGVVAARWDKVKVPDHDAEVLRRLDELGA